MTGNISTGEAPKTFRDNKPVQDNQGKGDNSTTEPKLKPTPMPDTQLNSLPAPTLPDPNNRRTAALPKERQAFNVRTASTRPQPAPSRQDQ